MSRQFCAVIIVILFELKGLPTVWDVMKGVVLYPTPFENGRGIRIKFELNSLFLGTRTDWQNLILSLSEWLQYDKDMQEGLVLH